MPKIIPKKEVKEDESRVDEKISLPGKYEITDDCTFRIRFSTALRSGRWVICEEDKKNPSIENHWVEFRMWRFDEEIELRKMSTNYDPLKRVHLIDHDTFNRLKIQRLMKDWSFAEGNDRLKLLHVNKVLVDESYNMFKNLHPNLSRKIIEEMNNVLEYNE